MTRKAACAALAAITLLVCIRTGALAAVLRLNAPAQLKHLQQTRPKHLNFEAGAAVRTNYQTSRSLVLDLIFYKWVCRTAGLSTDIDRLDEIVTALTEYMVDSGVGWANSVLRGTGSRGGMLNLQDERIKALADLRDTIRLGISNQDISPIRAADTLSRAVSMCSEKNMELTGAAILVVLGDQYFGMDHYKEAEACYERARGVFREYNAGKNLARVYEDLGTLYSNMRSYAVASESFKAAGELLAGEKRGDLAGQQYIQAGVALAAYGRRERALELMMYGLTQSRDWALVHKSYGQLVKDLRDFGDFLITQGDVMGARDMYDEAVKKAELAGDRESQIRALKELHEVLVQGGSEVCNPPEMTPERVAEKRRKVIEKALSDAQSAVQKTSKKTGVPVGETERLLRIIMLGAWAATEMGKPELSESLYKHAASLYHRLGNAKGAVQALEMAASSSEERGDDAAALASRLDAAMMAESLDAKSVLTADAKMRVAESYAASARTDMAITVFGECETIYRTTGAMRQLAGTLQKRGDLFLQLKQYEMAAKDFREAASIYLNEMGEPWTAAQAYWKLADAQAEMGDTNGIAEILDSAVVKVEQWCSDQSIEPDLEPLGSQILSLLYTRLIPMQIQVERKQRAWELLKASERYRWHANLLTALRVEKDPRVAAMVEEYERAAQGRPYVRPGAQREIKQVAGTWAEMVDYSALLTKWYPSLYRSMRLDPLEVAKFAGNLPDGVAVINYLLTDTASYAFIISKNSSTVWQLAATRQQVEELTRRFSQEIRQAQDTAESGMPLPSGDWQSDELKPVVTVLSNLYTLLIEPVRGELTNIRSIAFYLPSELSGFPMHALARLQPDGTLRFLVEDLGVGYVGPNSFMDLVSPGAGRIDPSRDRLAVFADPASNLPGAREEAASIQARFPRTEVYLGEKATRENFILAARSCNILHVAAHHKLDPDQSRFSLALAPGAASDGVVHVGDLRNPSASLIVLSVCEALGSANPTADDEATTAELLSAAGFPSVLGGLWKVSDKASSKLMDEFYRALSTPTDSKAEALRRAQRALIDSGQFKHPYYWAGFALYGSQN